VSEVEDPKGLVCPRCHARFAPIAKRGRRPVWCSQACRRAAYEERRAARNGAIAVRVEIQERVKVVERRIRIVERPAPVPRAAPTKPKRAPIVEAIEAVVASPRACSTVLLSLGAKARSGELSRSENGPTVRAAVELLRALRDAQLL
jgi:hypothetical protein